MWAYQLNNIIKINFAEKKQLETDPVFNSENPIVRLSVAGGAQLQANVHL